MKKFRFKKFSTIDKFVYHHERSVHGGKDKLPLDSGKRLYSHGFIDSFYGHDNRKAFTFDLGKSKGKAYGYGYDRGRKVAMEYFRQTGRQPSDIRDHLRELNKL